MIDIAPPDPGLRGARGHAAIVPVPARAVFAAALMSLLAACGSDARPVAEPSDATVLDLLDGVDLGPGWVEVAAREITPFAESIEPPCPAEPEMPFVDVDDVVESEIENVDRRMDVNLTVATFEGQPGEAAEVQAAWERMDCSTSNFSQSALDGLPAGVAGIHLASKEGSLNQVLLLSHTADDVALLIVSGDDDDPVDVARQLADNFAAREP